MNRREALITVLGVALLFGLTGAAGAQMPIKGGLTPPGAGAIGPQKDGPVPNAVTVPVPEDAALPPAGNTIRLTKTSGAVFLSCFSVPVQPKPATGSLLLFSRSFTTSESSSYVGVSLSAEAFLVPFATNGVGVAFDCSVEQDTTVPPDGIFDTVSLCSGLTTGFTPWYSFVPTQSANTHSVSAAYSGWAPAAPKVPTKVTINAYGQSWGTGTAGAYSCNNNLKIEY